MSNANFCCKKQVMMPKRIAVQKNLLDTIKSATLLNIRRAVYFFHYIMLNTVKGRIFIRPFVFLFTIFLFLSIHCLFSATSSFAGNTKLGGLESDQHNVFGDLSISNTLTTTNINSFRIFKI